jgi:predicted TIM-barrel fold metal-dependent hydrolase
MFSWRKKCRFGILAATLLLDPAAAAAAELPIIDAHSQIDERVGLDRVVPLLDQAGVARVILSARGRLKSEGIAALARRHPERVIAAVRTKSRVYADNRPVYYRLLEDQLRMPEFQAMAELILWHAAKGQRAPQWVIPAHAPQVRAALAAVFERGWPAVLHYEFAAAGTAAEGLMAELEGLLRARPGHPFVLTHMGQLDIKQTRRLIESHANIHFMPSWSNSITRDISRQPWINLFVGRRLAPDWKALIEAHPERFVLGLDNVFAEHWGDLYVRQVALWREALGALPDEAAHAVAHGNAERLWKLAPL